MERITGQNRVPLVEGLLKYIKGKPVAFHTPGHKGNPALAGLLEGLSDSRIFEMDLTEIPGLDDLHNPAGIIEESQRLLAEAYGADRSFFLVNGSTCGIEALIMAVCSPGDRVIVPRNAHKSVLGGLILSGAVPVYINPYVDEYWGIPLGIRPEDVEETLRCYGDIEAVLLVNPTYHGICGDLKAAVRLAVKFNIPLLVDEAHGPHLKFSRRLPTDALEAGSSGCVQSPHKMLGSLTQSSWLHIKGSRINIDRLKGALQILQSSSPSYILMASLDAARYCMVHDGKKMLDGVVDLAQEACERINTIPGARCLGQEVVGEKGVTERDPTKLVITCREAGIPGTLLGDILRRDYKIQPEYSDFYNITLFVTIGNKENDLTRLVYSLEGIIKRYSARKPLSENLNSSLHTVYGADIPRQVMSPREAYFAPKRKVGLRDSIGYISGEMVAPYPPGIPLLCPGEEITGEIVDKIRILKEMGTAFHGPGDPDLKYISVIA
ncbi:Arginine decarboxylase [Koleobacter methoxysyntrophicus]|uniref:Arginine decarboxylase n=1 Tax=Koleobacter methoxysyntrophicus TaxID=2751313 RepID=A0A8A0RJF0_9FIRM|nr:aminotransferase class I/II-fold pyridoxal phosphate-dependent enzyme [Koleobacter methoxysyntrophicus]QSQ08571.1 Arginine decarboxylase [Koleobacter methoxysyntrophicus]